MVRRTACLVGSLALAASLFATPSAGAAADASTYAAAGSVSAPAAKAVSKAVVSTKCKKRLASPRDVVPSKRFSKCVVKAMSVAGTAHLRSRHSDGMSSKGPVRFTRITTETSATYSDGSALVVLGRDAWHKQPRRGWVKAKANGNADQQVAEMIRVLWLATASMDAYRGYLSSSTTGWTPTGKQRTINGRKAREYTGTPVFEGVTVEQYSVWVDALDRPIRVASKVSFGGITSASRQDFTTWAKKVTIKKPKVS